MCSEEHGSTMIRRRCLGRSDVILSSSCGDTHLPTILMSCTWYYDGSDLDSNQVGDLSEVHSRVSPWRFLAHHPELGDIIKPDLRSALDHAQSKIYHYRSSQ